MFRGNLCRAAPSKQYGYKIPRTVGLRESPRSSIDQGEALHRGEVRLTFTQDCRSGQAFLLGIIQARGRPAAVVTRTHGRMSTHSGNASLVRPRSAPSTYQPGLQSPCPALQSSPCDGR